MYMCVCMCVCHNDDNDAAKIQNMINSSTKHNFHTSHNSSHNSIIIINVGLAIINHPPNHYRYL